MKDKLKKEQNFTEHLQEQHAKDYHGTDDDMPDAFLDWLDEQEQWEMINYADDFALKLQSETRERTLEEGKELGIRRVGKWIKFPYRKGMARMEVKGLGVSKGGGCELCGGKLVYIRGQYPGMKKRKVCPTCATEIIESLNSNCNNRDAHTTVEELKKG